MAKKWPFRDPGPGPGRGFYINPSRRGPAVPAGVRDGKAAQAPILKRPPGVGGYKSTRIKRVSYDLVLYFCLSLRSVSLNLLKE